MLVGQPLLATVRFPVASVVTQNRLRKATIGEPSTRRYQDPPHNLKPRVSLLPVKL